MADITSTLYIDLKASASSSNNPPVVTEPSVPSAPAWEPPADWPDISLVGDNEINLLVTSGPGFAFKVTTASGTFSIDWGDGSFQHDCVSDTIYSHEHLINGTPCSLGYNTWKVRIYNASDNISRFLLSQSTFISHPQINPVLSVVFGTRFLTSLDSAFLNCSSLQSVVFPSSFALTTTAYNACYGCKALANVVLPVSFGAITTVASMFRLCYSLKNIALPSDWGTVTSVSYFLYGCGAISHITLPVSWGFITDASRLFGLCYSLTSIVLPASWGAITDVTSMFQSCYSLSQTLLPVSWGNITNASLMFSNCNVLHQITLPDSWGLITNTSSMFAYCYSLHAITLPASWGNITTTSSMFVTCDSLTSVNLPATWGSITTTANMFQNCKSLTSITLPAAFSAVLSDAPFMFAGCFSLKTINNLHYFGSQTVQCNMNAILLECEFLQQNIVIGSLLTQITIQGSASYKSKINSLRLTNPGSLFAAMYVLVNYTSLDETALELLINDLPFGLTSKILSITGSSACNPITKSCILTAGSRSIAIADTTNLTVGMEVTGSSLNLNLGVTLVTTGNLISASNHGLDNGQAVYFTSGTAGFSLFTMYYVINKTATNFQIATAPNGTAITITGNGISNMSYIPKIVSIVPNTSVLLDTPAFASQTVTAIFTVLKRSKLLSKGWTLTM